MFSCFLCTFSNLALGKFLKHLRQVHALYDNEKLRLKCFSCTNIYETFSGYRRHIQKCNTHKINKDRSSISNVVKPQTELICASTNEHFDFGCNLTSNTNQKSLSDYCASYVSSLYSLGLPDSTIQNILEMNEKLLKIISDTRISSTIAVQNAFSDINTKYKRELYFKKHIVEPIEIPIGIRYDQIWNKEKFVYEQILMSCHFMYVPILKTLQFLLKNDSFRKLLFQKPKESHPNILSEFSHGSIFRKSAFFKENPHAFQLQLYFDEFDTVNPLGSKTGGHKIGAIYMMIKNLPAQLNSVLENIHLVALFYANDIKKFGMNSVLDIIVKDIKILEEQGVYDDVAKTFLKGTVVSLSHDNLGANQIFGMVESFSSTNYCRICIANKTDAQSRAIQDESLLRSDFMYEQHCRSLKQETDLSKRSNNTVCGIKFRSSLNNLTQFKLCNNQSVDIMHDLLEGVIQLELKLFFKFLISEKIITLEDINDRIKSFNFGHNYQCTKPSPISLDKLGNSIGQRAAQTFCLLKFIPLILSDKILSLSEQHQRKYQVIQLILKIVNIVFSTVNTKASVSELKELIRQHHELVIKEYNINLTPKHHFMIHYPYIILKMGPLIGLCCMRFEAKHGYFKNLVTKLKNYKSLCKTLSFRHQEHIWHQWNNINLGYQPLYGKCSQINYKNKLYSVSLKHFVDSILGVEDNYSVTVTNSVTAFSTFFQKKMFVTLEHDEKYPLFSEIIELLIINNSPYLICTTWDTITFNEIYQAYIIRSPNNTIFEIVDLKSVNHFVSYELHHPFGSNINAIVPKYSILS
ncbi:uncharacterized protein LOC135133729 [Zophobas morio]|uniref:uncharacterized protein LOC135133729 n=1 Tax=Zophobas morio TaxID=2755281 RepID=UPI00308333B1